MKTMNILKALGLTLLLSITSATTTVSAKAPAPKHNTTHKVDNRPANANKHSTADYRKAAPAMNHKPASAPVHHDRLNLHQSKPVAHHAVKSGNHHDSHKHHASHSHHDNHAKCHIRNCNHHSHHH